MTKAPPPQPISPGDLETPGHDSTPTLPVPGAEQIRAGQIADGLDLAQRDAYIEANVLKEMLVFVNSIDPGMIAGFIASVGGL